MPRVVFNPPPDVLEHVRGAAAARRARELVRQRLAPHEEFADHRDDAALLTSELVANAITAARECTVSIWYLPQHRALRVEVYDTSTERPRLQPVQEARIGGHGLRIVDSIASAWGTLPAQGGKRVWFEIHRDD